MTSDRALAAALAAPTAAAVEDLLDRHWRRSYSLALGVTGDPALAEDAVQEAFVAALRRVDRFDPARGSFGAWLGRIVQNAARDQLRARGRRRRHEEGAAGPDRAPTRGGADAEDVTALLEELSRLPDDLRTAVLLKHGEGLTYREVGEALGWPEGTATTRARRGLETLRGRLERRGVRASAVPLLLRGLPRLAAPPSAAALLAQAAPAARTTLVGAKLLVGLAAALVVLAALAVAGRDGPTARERAKGPGSGPRGGQAPTPADAAADPRRAGGGDDRARAAALPREPSESAAAGEAEPGHALVSGRVSGGGAGLTGLWVAVQPVGEHDLTPAGELAPARRGEALALGRDAGLWLVPPEAVLATAFPPGPRLARPWVRPRSLEPGRGTSGGTFAVELAPGTYAVVVGAAARRNGVAVVRATAGGRVEVAVDLAVEPAAHVVYEVVDEAGAPLPGIELLYEARGPALDALPGPVRPMAQVATDDRGRLDVWLAPGEQDVSALHIPEAVDRAIQADLRAFLGQEETQELSATPPPVRTAEVERLRFLPGETVARRLVLRAREETPVRVRVVDSAGGPVADARVRLEARVDLEDLNRDEAPRGRGDALTDAAGQARLPAPAGALLVTAWSEGQAWGRSELVSHGAAQREVVVVLDRPLPAASLRLRLEGDDLPPRDLWRDVDAWVVVGAEPGRRVGPRASEVVEEGGAPELVLRGLPEGRADVHVEVHAWRSAERSESAQWTGAAAGAALARDGAGGAPVVVRLSQGGAEERGPRPEDTPPPPEPRAWEVVVTDEEGQPIEGAEVNPRPGATTATDAAGRARWESGWFPTRLRIRADGYRTELWYPPGGAFAPAARVVLLRKPGLGRCLVRGRVVDAAGRPLAGARVEVAGRDAERAPGDTTAADGTFVVDRAPSGEIYVAAFRADLGVSAIRPLTARPGAEVAEVILTLTRGRRVRVAVRGAGGAERLEARVRADHPFFALGGGRALGDVELPRRGLLDLGYLPPGTWRVEVLGRRLLGAREVVVAPGGEPLEVELELTEQDPDWR